MLFLTIFISVISSLSSIWVSENEKNIFIVEILGGISFFAFVLLAVIFRIQNKNIFEPLARIQKQSEKLLTQKGKQELKLRNCKISCIEENLGRIWELFNEQEDLLIQYNRDFDKQIERRSLELIRSERRFRGIFNYSPVGICLIDLDGRIYDINPTLERLLGYKKEDLFELGVSRLSHELDSMKDKNAFYKIRDEKKSFLSYEKRFVHQSGKLIWTNITMSGIRDENASLSFVLAMVNNITAKKKAEEELKYETGYNIALAQLAQNILSPELSVIKIAKIVQRLSEKLTDSTKGFVGLMNPEMTAINIYTSEKTTFELRKTKEAFPSYLGQALNTKEPFLENDIKEELCNNVKELNDIYNFLSIPAIANNKLLGQIALANKIEDFTYNDLSKLKRIADLFAIAILRKNVENDLIKAKRNAESANRAKSIFLANMSHEVRTPLNSVIGFANILAEKIENPSYQKYLESIITNGSTLLSIINDVLDLSKIEEGKLSINPSMIELEKTIMQVKEAFIFKAKEKKLDIIIQNRNLPEWINLDELRLRQVIFNLVDNAIKYTNKGEITISTEIEKTNKKENIANLIVKIKDTGIGIPEKLQKDVFVAFRQQGNPDTKKFAGAGLGLAISKRLLELMNGEISLESKEGVGSVFKITIKNLEYIPRKRKSQNKANTLNPIGYENPKVLHAEELDVKQIDLETAENFGSDDPIETLPESAVRILNTEFVPKWEKINDSQSIFEITKFGKELKEFGEKHKSKQLINYASKLIVYAENIDVENIIKTLGLFRYLIINLSTKEE